MKIFNFWDALTRQRTDGALARLITPVHANEDVAQAEARLTAFTRAIVPVLDEFCQTRLGWFMLKYANGSVGTIVYP